MNNETTASRFDQELLVQLATEFVLHGYAKVSKTMAAIRAVTDQPSLNLSTIRRLNALDHLEYCLRLLNDPVDGAVDNGDDRTHRPFALSQIVNGVVALLESFVSTRHVKLDFDVPDHAIVEGDAGFISAACCGLILDAIQNMPNGGEIAITAVVKSDHWELEIADASNRRVGQRTAYETDQRKSLPERWIRSTSIDHVTQRQGGSISVNNCPQGGLAWSLRFPIQAARRVA